MRDDDYGHWLAWNSFWTGKTANLYKGTTGAAESYRRHWGYFRRMVGNVDGLRCIEVGCGRGTLTQYLAAAGAIMTSVDASEEACRMTEANLKKSGLKSTVINEDFRDVDCRRRWDVAVSAGFLEHCNPLSESIDMLSRLATVNWHMVVMKSDHEKVTRYNSKAPKGAIVERVSSGKIEYWKWLTSTDSLKELSPACSDP